MSSPESGRAEAGPSGCDDASGAAGSNVKKRPVACIVLGMAGSGKTTLMQRLNAHLHERKTPYYLINLDPAVLDTPFGANIDIRDTVNYREVMRQYQLGPNGGILTSLNLFATRFEDVMRLVEARAPSLEYVLLDTPGQIEIFTWSASGSIISESLASSMPTIIVYVVDTPRCASAVTFMSNMLYVRMRGREGASRGKDKGCATGRRRGSSWSGWTMWAGAALLE
jgi:GTPase SAR1 family protein